MDRGAIVMAVCMGDYSDVTLFPRGARKLPYGGRYESRKCYKTPKRVALNDHGPGVSSEVTVVMLQWSVTWPEF